MDNESLYLLASLVGMFIGLAGWLSKRDGKNSSDAEWKGSINAKLDTILGISPVVDAIGRKVDEHSIELAKLSDRTKSAHERIDRHKIFCEKQMEKKEHGYGAIE